jgi:hypothetical protein
MTKQTQDAAKDEKLQAAFEKQAAGWFANAKLAFKLADVSKVVENDDGTFYGLDHVIEKLAQDEPWALAEVGAEKPKPALKTENSEETLHKIFFGGIGQKIFEPKKSGVRKG